MIDTAGTVSGYSAPSTLSQTAGAEGQPLSLKGTYASVEPFQLFRYLDEQAFRFNERKTMGACRFLLALVGICHRRLNYTALTCWSCRKRAEKSVQRSRRG